MLLVAASLFFVISSDLFLFGAVGLCSCGLYIVMFISSFLANGFASGLQRIVVSTRDLFEIWYGVMWTEFLWLKVENINISGMWFQQDGMSYVMLWLIWWMRNLATRSYCVKALSICRRDHVIWHLSTIFFGATSGPWFEYWTQRMQHCKQDHLWMLSYSIHNV